MVGQMDRQGYRQITEATPWHKLSCVKTHDLSKSKAFEDNKLNVCKIMVFVSDILQIMVRKGENTGNLHVHLFPPRFQKPCDIKAY